MSPGGPGAGGPGAGLTSIGGPGAGAGLAFGASPPAPVQLGGGFEGAMAAAAASSAFKILPLKSLLRAARWSSFESGVNSMVLFLPLVGMRLGS